MMGLDTTVDVIGLLQGLIRGELRKLRVAEAGVVEQVYSHESGGDKNNHSCDVKLRDSGLLLPKVPVAVQRVGLSCLPNPGDLVLVQFLGGDIHGAVITGRFHNDDDRPPEAKAQEWVYVCPDASDSGLRRVYVELPEGNTLTVEDSKITLECGSTKVVIKNGGDVDVQASGSIKLKADGDIQIEAGGNLSAKAEGKMTLKASLDMALEGMGLSAKAQTTAQLEGGAQAGVKGPMIALAGMTNFSPS